MDKINEVLLKNNERLMAQNEALTEQVKQLNEQIAYMSRKLFDTSSEKTSNENQLSLFEEPEVFKNRSQPK